MRVLLYTTAALPFLAAGLIAGQPTPISVAPASQTYTTTAATAYTFVASDSDGTSDLLGIDAQFGTTGETDCWLFYNRSTNQISVFNQNQSNPIGTWVTEPAGQPGATLYGLACNIDPSTVSASASGNNLSVTATITLGGATGTNSISLSALNVSGTGSPYVKLGTYSVQSGTGGGSFTVAISPDEAFIANGGTTTATVTVTDGPGFNGTVNLTLGTFPQGSGLSGSLSQTSISGNGSSTLTITSGSESPTSRDPVTISAAQQDGTNRQSVQFATMIDTGPPTVQMHLDSGLSGSRGDFEVDVDDGATAEAIQGYNVLFNTAIDGRNACWVWFDARTGYIWLASDDTTSWSGVRLNGPVTISNSQCTVGSFNSDIRNPGTLGTALATSITISFAPGFAGTKNVYSNGANFAGFTTGYQLQGTYTVQ